MPLSEFDREHMTDIIAGDGDWFTAHLLRLIHKADDENRALLRIVFPKEVEAHEHWNLTGRGEYSRE